MSKIRQAVMDEFELQKSLGFRIPPQDFPPLIPGLEEAGLHDLLEVPYIAKKYLKHAIIARSPKELKEAYQTLKEMGYNISGVDQTIAHEQSHGEMCRKLGQRDVRHVLRLKFSDKVPHQGKLVKAVSATPSTILEGIKTSRVGFGLMLAAPAKLSEDDKVCLAYLGLNPKEVRRIAAEYNRLTGKKFYPV